MPSELGLEDVQEIARQRIGGKAFYLRGNSICKGKIADKKLLRILGIEELNVART